MLDFIEYIVKYKFKNQCPHANALIDTNEGYCPDCGEYLKKYFYIVRCNHCEIKREAKMKNGIITPATNFCPNCGGMEFYIERHEKINLTDVRFVICKKETIREYFEDSTQIWVEENNIMYLENLVGL